jgi:N-acetylneuraminic acid mutarotase
MPTERTGHNMNFIGDKLYVFAGSNNMKILNDLWCFDTLSMKWEQVHYIGEISLRSGSKSCVYGDFMYIYGGYTRRGGEYFNSLHRFSHTTRIIE